MPYKGYVPFGSVDSLVTDVFNFNQTTITAQGKPTQVTLGTYKGYSLPVYNSDNEELFSCKCVSPSWDGITNPVMYVGGWLDTANTDKNFKLQVSWSHTTMNGTNAVDQTTHDVEVETATGTAAQYTAFKIAFTLDLVGQSVSSGDAIGVRLRRIAASSNEISGEFVAEGEVLTIAINKIGN